MQLTIKSLAILLITIFLPDFAMAENSWGTLGFEHLKGANAQSDRHISALAGSANFEVFGPLVAGGDLSFNFEQVVLEDIDAREFEHEAYLNLKLGLTHKFDKSFRGAIFGGYNSSWLEKDNEITTEETDLRLDGTMYGIELLWEVFSIKFQHIDSESGYEFDSITLSLAIPE